MAPESRPHKLKNVSKSINIFKPSIPIWMIGNGKQLAFQSLLRIKWIEALKRRRVPQRPNPIRT